MATSAAGVEVLRDVPNKVTEHARTFFQKMKHQASRIGPFGWAAIVAALALLATGTVIGLIVFTPVFIIFSPILVPLGFVLFLCAAGVVTTGGASVAALSAVTWLYRYFKGRHPVGSHKVDKAVSGVHDTTLKARDVAAQLQAKAQETVAAA